MCKEWSYSTLTFRGATVLIIAPSALDSASFFTPYWLQSFPSPKLPSPKFTNLGLWHACSNGFHDKGHKYKVKIYGCRRNFMPDCEYNYLSWSFGLAFVGVVMMYVTAVLFLVEAPIMQRKEIASELQKKQQYPMERSV